MSHVSPATESQLPLVTNPQYPPQTANPYEVHRPQDMSGGMMTPLTARPLSILGHQLPPEITDNSPPSHNTMQPQRHVSLLNTSERGERTANAYAILFALFSGVHVQLLSSIPIDSGVSQATITLFYVVSYTGLILNLVASLTAMLCIHVSNSPIEEQHVVYQIKCAILPKLHCIYKTAAVLGTPLILTQILLHALVAQNTPILMVLAVTVMFFFGLVPIRVYRMTRLAPHNEQGGA